MDKPISIDERLKMCASLVSENARLVDVGCDHAYLPIWLIKQNKISHAIAADINELPLLSGKQNAESYGADNIEFRLGSGLEPVSLEDSITDVIIAGMGGEVIRDIVLDSPLTRDKNLNLILQPMTRSEDLIKALYKNGFEIKTQKCVVSKNKCYTVMAVHYTGKTDNIGDTFPYLGKLDLKDETNLRFIGAHLRNLENKSKGDKSLLHLINKIKKMIE